MRPALSTETLLGAALAGRAPRSEAAPRREGDAGFAGLLDGARQQQGRAGAREGSAFDVPEARPEATAARSGSQAQIERRQMDQRQLDQRQLDQRQHEARAEARRDDLPEAAREAAPRGSEARPAAPMNKPRAGEAAREPDRARPEDTAEAEADGVAPEAVAAGEATQAKASRAEGEPPTPAAPTTQAWMARFAMLSGAAAPAQAGADATTSLPAALQRLSGTAGAPSAEGLSAPAASPTAAWPDTAPAAADASPADPAAPLAAAALPAEAASPLPAVQATASAPGGSTAVAAPATATASASLPVPLDAPDFSQALGWQLATLARDGVHEAQLQLNPVEMGPVQVQILLDGGQAQIDFTAAQARTREVLEAGWPALAAAMHAAGFTLGGGGVFEQRSPEGDAQGQGEGAHGRAGRGDGDASAQPGLAPIAPAGPRGLLDLYA